MTVTKDDWLLIAGKRQRGDEIIAFSERFKLPPNIDLTGARAPWTRCSCEVPEVLNIQLVGWALEALGASS